jgi:hypothetical protein
MARALQETLSIQARRRKAHSSLLHRRRQFNPPKTVLQDRSRNSLRAMKEWVCQMQTLKTAETRIKKGLGEA